MNLSIRTRTRLTIVLFLIKTWITISTCTNDSVLIGLPNPEAASSGARIVLNKSLKIRSFCARINFSRVSGNQLAFFSKSKSNNFSVLFKHNANYGFIALNSIRNYFDILEKPTPFTFQHFCFSHNVTNYLVASEGKIWHSHKFEQSDIETVDALHQFIKRKWKIAFQCWDVGTPTEWVNWESLTEWLNHWVIARVND